MTTVPRTCSVKGCERPVFARGWCQMHYARWYRHDDPLYQPPPRVRGTCSVEGCEKPHLAKGYCGMHYYRVNCLGTIELSPRPQPSTCRIEGCERRSSGLGYCKMHYSRLVRTGTTDRARKQPGEMRWRSGSLAQYRPRHPLADKNGVVLVNRLVLYRRIGKGEHRCHWCHRVVSWDLQFPDPGALLAQHLDGDKTNNEPSNLAPICIGCLVIERDVWRQRRA